MTLRDKICNNIPEVTCKNVDLLEKITDDYAIEFAEWVTDSRNKNVRGSISIEELLNIFKKEKGL